METNHIKLVFSFNREIMQFIILNKEIYYTDRVWQNWIRILPKDPALVRKLIMSRNRLPKHIINMFNLTWREVEEYNRAKDDEELAEIVINDAKKKGCKFERRL